MTDILIIGSGGAGLSAALKAKELNKNIIVASKTYPTHSQTCQAQGGINATLESTKDDSINKYIEETFNSSHKIANLEHIKYFCSNSKNTIDWLDTIGVPFSRDEKNSIAQRRFGGSKIKRTCYSSDYTGLKILHTLYDQCIKNNIKFLNEYFLLKLIIEEETIKGAIFLDIKTGNLKQISAKSVILATGGYAGIYDGYTTNSYASTGEGIACAFKEGIKLSNMEFIQFHPTSLKEKNILISESARGEGAYLVDSTKNRFIDELKPRDEVARAIFEKNKKDTVFLDLRHLGKEKIEEALPQERKLIFDFTGLKMEENLIPVSPAAHYSMGGILTDINAKTNIKNLFACGECAQSGIHGANRLGGNSLQEIIAFGRLAGKKAAIIANKITNEIKIKEIYLKKEEERVETILNKENKINLFKKKKNLGSTLFEKVGLFREKNSLKEALIEIETQIINLEKVGIEDKSKKYNRNLVDYLEYENMLLLSKLVTTCAYNREESRGSHYRIDYLQEKKELEKISISQLKNSQEINTFEEIK